MKHVGIVAVIGLVAVLLVGAKSCLPEPEVIIEPQKKALLVMLENNSTVPDEIVEMAPNSGDYTDYYGEATLEAVLTLIALPFYDMIVVLTDEQVVFDNIKLTLDFLAQNGYQVDIISDVHGGRSRQGYYLLLHKNEATESASDPIGDFRLYAEELQQLGYYDNLNAVYQVSCYGGAMLDAWLQVGAQVVNGARGVNYYVITSPIVFLEEWVAGAPFADAVQVAYDSEQYMLDVVIGDDLGLGSDWMDEMFFSDGECRTDVFGDPVCSCAESSEMVVFGT